MSKEKPGSDMHVFVSELAVEKLERGALMVLPAAKVRHLRNGLQKLAGNWIFTFNTTSTSAANLPYIDFHHRVLCTALQIRNKITVGAASARHQAVSRGPHASRHRRPRGRSDYVTKSARAHSYILS